VRLWVLEDILAACFGVSHGYYSPADGTGVLDPGPMPQAVAVEHMLLRTRQDVDFVVRHHTHVADRTISPCIRNVALLGLPQFYIDDCIALLVLGAAATVDGQA